MLLGIGAWVDQRRPGYASTREPVRVDQFCGCGSGRARNPRLRLRRTTDLSRARRIPDASSCGI